MDLSLTDFDFLDSFNQLNEYTIDKHNKNKLNVFMLKINANMFDYKYLQDSLLEPLVDFSLSRTIKEEYKHKPAHLSKKAREKFIEYVRNKGELGELLLYCFLESHLKAPKILSKLELKTSTSHYVNGSDGVHFLKLDNGNYQLIFGESKTIKNLTSALSYAFKSIDEFKRGVNTKEKNKSGLTYEKSLISDHLTKETFSDEEKKFIKNIIYPSRKNDIETDDAFGIFVGYEIKISETDIKLPNDVFRKKIQDQIQTEIASKLTHITKKIEQYKLYGHNFYIYILPFTDLDDNRATIQEIITA